MWLNAGLLLDIVSISFVTRLLGSYAGHPGQTAAALIYGITWTVGGVFLNATIAAGGSVTIGLIGAGTARGAAPATVAVGGRSCS